MNRQETKNLIKFVIGKEFKEVERIMEDIIGRTGSFNNNECLADDNHFIVDYNYYLSVDGEMVDGQEHLYGKVFCSYDGFNYDIIDAMLDDYFEGDEI